MLRTFAYALRSLKRSPGFAILAMLTIALGTGVNTAVFSIVHAVLLKALPFSQPEHLVRISETKGPAQYNVSYPNFRDWRDRSSSFESLAIYSAFGLNPMKLPGGSLMVPTGSTSWNLFSVLGVQPLLGRPFRADDDQGDGADITLISYQAWVKHFNQDPDIVGRQLAFYGQPITIVGVLPKDVLISGVDFWMPRGEIRNPNQLDRGNHPGLQVIGRLKSGITLDHARGELNGIAAALEKQYPATNTSFRVRCVPLLDSMVSRVAPMLWILFGAVGFVLLIACANVTNLLLVRSIHREREFAIGASRLQSMGLVLAESLVLAAGGAVVAMLLASWGVTALLEEELQYHLDMKIEEDVAKGMSREEARRSALVAFGGLDQQKEECRDARCVYWLDSLVMDMRYALRGFRNSPGFAFTVIGTLALGLVVLATSFTVFNAIVLRPFAVRDPYSLYAFTGWASSKNEGAPGKWTLTWQEFQNFRRENPAFSEVLGYQPGIAPIAGKSASIQAVTGNYFTMLGAPICMGRSLIESDDESGEAVAVTSYAAWKSRFGSDPGIVGRTMRLGESAVEIVGVACPEFNGPQVESVDFWVSLALSRELGIRKMYSNLVETAPTNPRSSALGGVPKTPQGEFPKLKIVGRLKPGMTRESAEAALLAYGLGITLVGVAAGLAGAIGLTRFLQSLLFNITASDPITYLNIAALFGAVTMLASSVPARKAMRVDPAIMLRNE